MAWLILAIMGAVTYLYGVSTHAMVLCLLTKPVPVLALLGWLHSGPVSPYRRWISIGLGFSLLGDILLAWPQDLFVFGLGAFLFAHLAYLKAYLVDCRRPAVPALILALLAGGSAGLTLFGHDLLSVGNPTANLFATIESFIRQIIFQQ